MSSSQKLQLATFYACAHPIQPSTCSVCNIGVVSEISYNYIHTLRIKATVYIYNTYLHMHSMYLQNVFCIITGRPQHSTYVCQS